ncbi:MAG: hypothetical protein LBC68_03545 [Prevotellaceae bacterium]|jgi:hypothetical protein|nr:hypothetical protein [Prevotellaceae bacterium]
MKKNILKILAGLIIAVSAFACHDSRQRKLENWVKAFKEPIVIKKNALIFDSVSALPDFTLKMHATFLQNVDNDFLKESIQIAGKRSFVRAMYHNKEFKELMDEGLLACIVFWDLRGNYISEICTTAADFTDDILNPSEEEFYIESLRQQIQILQKTLPQNIEDGIVVCAADFNESTKTVEYTWTFEEGYDMTYFAASVEEFQQIATQSWKNFINSNEFIVEIIGKGFAWKYTFIDKDKTVLATAIFDEVKDLY